MYKIDTQVVCSSKLDGETLILNLDSGFYYTLDHAGQVIWEGLLSGQSKEQVISAVVAAYKVSEEEAEKDYEELVAMLESESLIEKSKG